MNTLFLLFLLQANPFTRPTDVANMTLPVSGVCATSDTSIPHGILLEGFQTATTGYENTWTEVGTTANITAAADSTTLTTGKPTGACNQAWKVIVPPAAGVETYARWNNGSLIDLAAQTLTIVCYLYIETAPDSTESYIVLCPSETTTLATGAAANVQIVNNAGTVQIRAAGASNSTYVNITTGEWHKLTLHLDTATTGFTSTFQLDSGTANTFNRLTKGVQYIAIGAAVSVEVNDSGTLWFDLICVSSP